MDVRLNTSLASLALQGIRAAESDAANCAEAVASGDLDNLAGNLVALSLARVRIAADAKVLIIADQTEQDVLDLIA